ncbi:hypothetical protein QJQ45_003887 [Haematococcus lacustris]|nr:hypothetical protein QJQ45_003887 [Haematococcus lacustris]
MNMSSADDVNVEEQLSGLQGLPAELLNAVLRQLNASSRLRVFRTSKFLAKALLRIVPSIRLSSPPCKQLRALAPFLAEVLQDRQQPKLDLTLTLVDNHLLRRLRDTDHDSQRALLVARMLGAVPVCGAVDCLNISWCEKLDLPWEPVFSAALAASFPSLTSLTFGYGSMSIGDLAKAINHPLLLPRLLHLDLETAVITPHEGQLDMSLFIGSRVQKLSLSGWVKVDEEREFLSGLLPLPPHLTQLTVTGLKYWCSSEWEHDWDILAEAVSSLTQLQQLKLYDEHGAYREHEETGPGPMALLQALAHLPSLHTLLLDDFVVGQEQLTALLKLTQITHLEVYGFSGLTSSRASSDCSWRRLEIWSLDWVSAAYLPLHSLTHPLWLQQLVDNGELDNGELVDNGELEDIEEPSIEVLAAAELNLCERNKAGLVPDVDMRLSKATVDLLTEQYLSHCRHAQHPPHPTEPSSSHSGPSTSLASSNHSGPSTSLASSSSPEGHITPGEPGSTTGQGGQQGSAAGAQPLMQRLGHGVEELRIIVEGLHEARLSSANQEALKVLFPTAKIVV